ncbi:MAG TPA: MarR family winged helix-turn-helix transcriptional regulator [Gaiellaceae bacterium]|nr:MarR family winged helix-turn-helix transcriptional regulator [Gaiellaceae bacterium]
MASPAVQPPITAPTQCVPRELLESPLFLLGRLGYEVKTEVMDAFEAAGFSAYCYSVLAVLDEGDRETQATIADTLKIDRGQLVGILDELEEHELIERKRDPNDRRRHLVSLTRSGKRQLTGYRRLARRLEDELLGPLGEGERAQLRGLLQRIAGARDTRYVPRP